MNYVKPIPGKWYRLHDREDGSGSIGNNVWIIYYNGSFSNCPHLLGKTFYNDGRFELAGSPYRLTEVLPEEVNPYVPEEYQIKNDYYEIY
jgi:hypothetical protein